VVIGLAFLVIAFRSALMVWRAARSELIWIRPT